MLAARNDMASSSRFTMTSAGLKSGVGQRGLEISNLRLMAARNHVLPFNRLTMTSSGSTFGVGQRGLEACGWRRVMCSASNTEPVQKLAARAPLGEWMHFGAAIGSFYVADTLLKKAFSVAGIAFPAPLIGMFGILGGLWGLSAAGRLPVAETVVRAAQPALQWVTRWLPLFYVPALVMLPIAVAGMAPSELGKTAGIVALGMPFSLFTSGAIVLCIRKLAAVKLLPVPPVPAAPPFTAAHIACCAAIAAASAIGLMLAEPDSDQAWGSQQLFLLACTVGGLLFGSRPPAALAKYMPHPVVATATFAHLGVVIASNITGCDYWQTLQTYMTKGKGGAREGAGDLLMSFLGVVVLSFGFHIFGQRALLTRHAMEVVGCAMLASLLSLGVTAAAGRALALPPELTLAVTPRSVTVALAMPIASQLGVSEELIPICATTVLLTGLIGAIFCQRMCDLARFIDPLTRGLATASSCHGFGTAALAASEPQALPFCALGYGLTGIAASCWVALPTVRDALVAIAGGGQALQ